MCSQNIPVYFSLSHFLPSIGPNTLQVLLVIRWYGKSLRANYCIPLFLFWIILMNILSKKSKVWPTFWWQFWQLTCTFDTFLLSVFRNVSVIFKSNSRRPFLNKDSGFEWMYILHSTLNVHSTYYIHSPFHILRYCQLKNILESFSSKWKVLKNQKLCKFYEVCTIRTICCKMWIYSASALIWRDKLKEIAKKI